MNILKFIMNNWHDILVIFVIIIAAYISITKWIKVNGPIFNSMSTAEKIAYVTRLLTNLVPIAMVLVTDAEINYGSETGVLKRSYVIGELYKLIPDEYKRYVTEENLDSIINKVLPEAEKLWAENPTIKSLVKGENTI